MLRRDMLLATAALPAAAVSFQQGGSGPAEKHRDFERQRPRGL